MIWKTVVAAGAMIAVPACKTSASGTATTPGPVAPAEPVAAEPPPPPVAPEPPPPVAVEPAEPEPPPPPVMITITVQSKPAGAEVYVGDEEAPRGKTPLTLEMEQGAADVQIRVMRKGYEEAVETVAASADRVVDVALVKVKPRPRVPRGGGRGVGRGFILS